MHGTPLVTKQHNIWKPTAWASSSRRQVLPEDCVVNVASTIKLESRSQADDSANTICNNCIISVIQNFEKVSNLWNTILLRATEWWFVLIICPSFKNIILYMH